MSLQVQPLPQQQQSQQFQQPVQQVYPTTYTYESPPHHSNGSFGSVFVVLAIIIVISAVACCLGRLCGRKSHGHSLKHSKQQKQQKQNQNHHDFRPTKEVDIEFGFDKKIAASKPMNGHGYGHGGGGGGRGPPKPLGPPHHGGGGAAADMNMKSFELKLGPPRKLRAGGP
ncbi:hypothetical protein HN51_007373 [Arachis hypogaea]|uniref:Transmembrane protein n=2 Tax=Arachis TaxID=3817 RepID=A0A445D8F2_ARAHY|nr:uncharacterized protein LOC107488785 [Arachis duranensis]XP_025699472.1 uncharacterized protein LOC112801125 [Arachis hypogaea]QHO41483.1 uncharacterized protein DS421_5g146130 [Arachis hypogaea]RYR59390.1 hypothetical protein Ahy_A05g025278 isoform C [Arachis hypogaea]